MSQQQSPRLVHDGAADYDSSLLSAGQAVCSRIAGTIVVGLTGRAAGGPANVTIVEVDNVSATRREAFTEAVLPEQH